MREKSFVDALIETIESVFAGVVLRPNDAMTLGVPDILAWCPVIESGSARPWSLAIEAKSLHPLMEDPFHKGRRIGQMLDHEFTGPQISLLRRLHAAGVEAFGLVRMSPDFALRFDPAILPAKTGNFTYEEMFDHGEIVRRRPSGAWHFWRE